MSRGEKKPMLTEKQIRVLMALYEKEWKDEGLSESLQTEYFLRCDTLKQVLGEESNGVTDAVRISTEYKTNKNIRDILADIEAISK